MLVYRDQRRTADPAPLLAEVRGLAARFVSAPSHDLATTCLVQAGVLESGVADALFPTADGLHPLADALGAASMAAGHVLWHSWHSRAAEAKAWATRTVAALGTVPVSHLPPQIEVSEPEGYAFYAVYPETYLEAARRALAALDPAGVVVLGLRSIGTSLSAAVAAACAELGCAVERYTLRPRAHPFDRRIALDDPLAHALGAAAERGWHFLVADEGPGISGSSFAGTAAALERVGVAADRVVLLPSWDADGSGLRSDDARARWGRHRRFVATFEEVWLDSGRLASAMGGMPPRELSAGRWRALLYPAPAAYPAVQPQHERRKYLGASLLWFGGLGGRAERLERRGRALAAAGFSPAPITTAHGFLVREFVEGTPVAPGETDAALLETAARYLAYLRACCPAGGGTGGDELRRLIAVNVAEGLGDAWRPRAEAALGAYGDAPKESPVALDGRMLPHEWLRTRTGYLKTDSLDHHDDHFFPGCQDVAWDVAAACLELAPDPAAREALVTRYRALSGDRSINRRLPFFALAYLAFRLGYATLAGEVLADQADGRRFRRLARRYALLLRRELGRTPGRGWDG